MNAINVNDIKIIIADESIPYRNNLATRLRFQGYNVEFANGGFHLVHLVEKYREPCLVIIHENMADMPAEEIIGLIRINKNKTDLPILFISRTNDDKKVFEMIKTGANDYIVKSANFQPIVDRVTKYLGILKNS